MASQQRLKEVAAKIDALPALMLSRDQISIWSILKHSVGKDLTRITMPIVFNEPLSFLQRLAEHMEYVHLIKRAVDTADPVLRVSLVAAFSVSALASNRGRVAKPFNPMLGETYELDRRDDLGFHYVAEQVCHHPPISAFHARGQGWTYSGSCDPRLKFFGQTVDCTPRGVNTLVLRAPHGGDETYTWNNPTCSVHNLVMGTMYIEHSGIVEVRNHTNGMTCVLNLKPCTGWFNKDAPSYIDGYVVDKHDKKLQCVYGEWSDFLAACSPHAYDQHFVKWLREHRDKRRNDKQATAIHLNAGDRASSTSSKTSRRQSTDGTQLQSPLALPLIVNSTLLWHVIARPPLAEQVSARVDAVISRAQYYHFSMFALMLNEWHDELSAVLPPTDSRRRSDIRLMESGDIGVYACARAHTRADNASSEKHRLEEKQRASAAARAGEHWTPLWFRCAPHALVDGETTWQWTGEYDQRDWTRCELIFDT